jgi:hypothetical protein
MEFPRFVLVFNFFTSTTTTALGASLLFVYTPQKFLVPSWRFFVPEGMKFRHIAGQRPTD